MVDTFTYIKSIALSVGCLWFTFWVLRRKYELDETLDRRAWIVRLSLVSLGFISLFFRSPAFMWVRIVFGVSAVCVIVWPNWAYRISRIGKSV